MLCHNCDVFQLQYTLVYKSRNFGPNLHLLFDIRLIYGSTKIQILKIRVRWVYPVGEDRLVDNKIN